MIVKSNEDFHIVHIFHTNIKKRQIRWLDIKEPYDLVLEDLEFWEITL